MLIDKLLEKPISIWMESVSPENEIVISSRVRLARNLKNYLFPLLITETQIDQLINDVSEIIKSEGIKEFSNMNLFLMKDINEFQKKALVEKHLISLNLAHEAKDGAVIVSNNESISIMLGEEDHVRIQCIFPGLQIYKAEALANKIDDALEKQLDYAFDEKYGYLTSCPTNVGTAIRASVMVHLPALVLSKQINRIIPAVTQVGLVVRGTYGEGSESIGNMFQISNQITLGQKEKEIIDNLHNVINQIIELEKQARLSLVKESRLKIEDKIGRSLGILSNAKIMDSKEATTRLSDLRLGIDLNMITELSPTVINELTILIQPGYLQYMANKTLSIQERDILRATIIREKLCNK